MPWPRQYTACPPAAAPTERHEPAAQRLDHRARHAERRAQPHGAHRPMAAQQAAAHRGAEDVDQRAAGRNPPVPRGRPAEVADVDHRREQQEAEEPAVGGRRHRGPGAERAAREHRARAAARCGRFTGERLARFAERAPAHREQQRGVDRHRHHHPAPSRALHQPCAEQRRRQPDHAQPGESARHHVRAFVRRIEIAHRRTRAHEDRGHRKALQRAPAREHRHAARERTAERGDRVAGEPREQHRPPAEAVRERAAQQLREAEGQHEQREAGAGRAELIRDGGERRQVAVGGHGLRREKQRQHQRERDVQAALAGDRRAHCAAGAEGNSPFSRRMPVAMPNAWLATGTPQ
jgi:hypothetical protein